MDDLDRLERLNRLRESGGLTQEEFEAQKARLLAEPTPVPPPAYAPPPIVEQRGTPPWPWIAGGVVLLLLVVIAAVVVGRGSVGDNVTLANEATVATTNETTPFPTPSASAPLRPIVSVTGGALMADGRPVQPAVRGNTALTIVRTVTIGDHDLYVVEDSGGTACPAQYRIADASAAGVTVSDRFGTCSDLVRIAEQPDGLSVSMPAFAGPGASPDDRAAIAGEQHLFRYADGRVRETVSGRRATPPVPQRDDEEDAVPEIDKENPEG